MSEVDQGRAAARLTADYVLRSLQLVIGLANGEFLTGLIAMAVSQANIAHLIQPEGTVRDPSPGSVPDDARRPVSVLAISQSLGLPYETTRRHIEKLVKAGYCVRVQKGVIVPAGSMDTEGHREMLATNLTNLRRLFRGLRSAGVDLG